MHVASERKGTVLIASVEGRVDNSNARSFQKMVQDTSVEGDRALVLDMSNLTYISSAGLRSILIIARNCKRETPN